MSEKPPHPNPLDSFYIMQKSRDWSVNGASPGVLSQVTKVAFLGGAAQVGSAVCTRVCSQPSWFRVQACEHHECLDPLM